MAEQHVKPVGEIPWSKKSLNYPNVVIPVAKDAKLNVFAPCDGIVEKVFDNDIIFKHQGEPYYSIFTAFGGELTLDPALKEGDTITFNTILANAIGELLWRVGSVGNPKDWMDPLKWLVGDFVVWNNEKSTDKAKSKTDWGTIALVVVGGYILLKGKEKK